MVVGCAAVLGLGLIQIAIGIESEDRIYQIAQIIGLLRPLTLSL